MAFNELADRNEYLEINDESHLTHEQYRDPLYRNRPIVARDNIVDIFEAENDMLLQVWVPDDFATYANKMVELALWGIDIKRMKEGLQTEAVTREPMLVPRWTTRDDNGQLEQIDFGGTKMHSWRIDKILMWQLQDRCIDELVCFFLSRPVEWFAHCSLVWLIDSLKYYGLSTDASAATSAGWMKYTLRLA